MNKIKTILVAAIFMLVGIGLNAQEYNSWIEGFYERHGEGRYTLKDVRTQGFTIDGRREFGDSAFIGVKVPILCGGEQTNGNLVQFSFKNAKKPCDQNIVFQYWDEDKYAWKTDVEACDNVLPEFKTNHIVIMLVLDYSTSMLRSRDNFTQLKSRAKEFLYDMAQNSVGNVHIGIIAFSGMDQAQEQIFPITPISTDNYDEFRDFIDESNPGIETALYYSVDEAMGMIENYVKDARMSPEAYGGGLCIITFTDGLDNASVNTNISPKMQRGLNNQYLDYLNEQLGPAQKKRVLGVLPIEHYYIGFSGSEDFRDEEWMLFNKVSEKITPDRYHSKVVSNFEDVKRFYSTITKRLIDRWQALNVYIGEAQYGRVRWAFNCTNEEVIYLEDPIYIEDEFDRFKIGAKASGTINNMLYVDDTNGNVKRDFVFGFNVGLTAEYYLTRRVSIGTEILFAQQGFRRSIDAMELPEEGDTKVHLDYTYRTNHINVPLLFRFYYKGFALEVGPQVGFAFGGLISENRDETILDVLTAFDTAYTMSDVEKGVQNETGMANYKYWNLVNIGATIGFSYNFPSGFYFGARYTCDFTDALNRQFPNNDHTWHWRNVKSKHEVISVSVGFKF